MNIIIKPKEFFTFYRGGSLGFIVIGVIGSVLGIALMYQLSLFFSDRLIKALVFEEKIKSFQFYIKKYSTGIIGLFYILRFFSCVFRY